MVKKHKIVILGAGFGGVYTIKHLLPHLARHKNFEITLINRSNYFLFTPLLHEVATGGLSPNSIIEPLAKIFDHQNIKIVTDDITSISLKNKSVKTTGLEIPYDVLLIALGAETNFCNVPGAAENSFTLKSINDAVAVKNRIVEMFDQSIHESNYQTHVAIVGGGATGVELAAEMIEFLEELTGQHFSQRTKPGVTLIQNGPELIPHFSQNIRQKALKVLTKNGVSVHLNTTVKAVSKNKLELADGSTVSTDMIIWVAGIKPQNITFYEAAQRDHACRLIVEPTLRLKNRAEVFAIGDITCVENGGQISASAQAAEAEAKLAAKNILNYLSGKNLENFEYKHQGDLISLGRWTAAAQIWGLHFAGRLAWWLWRTVYLSKFLSTRKKFLIALEWTMDIFGKRDTSKY